MHLAPSVPAPTVKLPVGTVTERREVPHPGTEPVTEAPPGANMVRLHVPGAPMVPVVCQQTPFLPYPIPVLLIFFGILALPGRRRVRVH